MGIKALTAKTDRSSLGVALFAGVISLQGVWLCIYSPFSWLWDTIAGTSTTTVTIVNGETTIVDAKTGEITVIGGDLMTQWNTILSDTYKNATENPQEFFTSPVGMVIGVCGTLLTVCGLVGLYNLVRSCFCCCGKKDDSEEKGFLGRGSSSSKSSKKKIKGKKKEEEAEWFENPLVLMMIAFVVVAVCICAFSGNDKQVVMQPQQQVVMQPDVENGLFRGQQRIF